jgi:3-isopropylmalate/(R)-2-methylmalate dehydratase large subunit
VPGDLVVGADSHTCTYGALGAFSTGVGSTDLGAVMATGMAWLKVPATIRVEYEGKLRPWVGGKDLILFTLGLIGWKGPITNPGVCGEVIRNLPMDHRFTMANMAVEGGAKNGIVEPDDLTAKLCCAEGHEEPLMLRSDEGASYERVIQVRARRSNPRSRFPILRTTCDPFPGWGFPSGSGFYRVVHQRPA